MSKETTETTASAYRQQARQNTMVYKKPSEAKSDILCSNASYFVECNQYDESKKNEMGSLVKCNKKFTTKYYRKTV